MTVIFTYRGPGATGEAVKKQMPMPPRAGEFVEFEKVKGYARTVWYEEEKPQQGVPERAVVAHVVLAEEPPF